MYPIIACDLDGTLFNSEHYISEYTKNTLKELVNQGLVFTFASGRHYNDVRQIRDSIGIEACAITSNGARIHDSQGNLIFKNDIDPNLAYELITFFPDKKEVYTNLYADDKWKINKDHVGVERFFQDSHFQYHLFQPNTVNLDCVEKVFFTSDDHECLLPYEEKLLAHFGDKLAITFSSPTCLEVMSPNISKGAALAKMVPMLGFDLHHCIAFGDGMNDVEMLSMVGKGCIMGNATHRLKETLPDLEVIGKNDDDGVSRYLRKLYFMEE